jgi:hypothetical protein
LDRRNRVVPEEVTRAAAHAFARSMTSPRRR